MKRSVFWDNLHELLEPHSAKQTRSPKKKHRDGAKNGLITSATRLSSAILFLQEVTPKTFVLPMEHLTPKFSTVFGNKLLMHLMAAMILRSLSI